MGLLTAMLTPVVMLLLSNGVYLDGRVRYADHERPVTAAGCSEPSLAWWACASGADRLLDRRTGLPPRVGIYDAPLDGPHLDLDADLEQADAGWTAAFWRIVGQGHGMAVAGFIGGAGSPGVTGIAPGARLVYYSYTRDDGPRSLEGALDHFESSGARFVSVAWLGEVDTGRLRRFVERGGLVVGGFANRNESRDDPPARYPGMLTVRALGPAGTPEPMGYGPSLDLLAPAPWQLSAAPHFRMGPLLTRPYGGGLCCNSAAVATTAGAAALLAWVDPALTGPQIHKRLLLSARPIPGQTDRWTELTGYGALDLVAAAGFDRLPPEIAFRPVGSPGTLLIETVDDVQPMPVPREHDRHLAPVPTSAVVRVEVRRAGSAAWTDLDPLPSPSPNALERESYVRRSQVTLTPADYPLAIRAVDSAGNAATVTVQATP